MLRRNSKSGRSAKAERKVKRPIVSIEALESRENPATAFVLSGLNLIAFDTANPAAATAPVAITGVAGTDTLVGIDVRPQNGHLYAVGVNAGGDATADTYTVYDLSPRTGVATAVGAPTLATVDLPLPANARYGVDFNPTVDRLRITTSVDGAGGAGLDLRVNPNNNALVNVDGAINGATSSIDEVAYTNSKQSATVTTLYTISSATDQIYLQNPPNNGTQVSPLGTPVSLNAGGTPLDVTAVNGFDIQDTVTVAASNAPVAAGTGLAIFTVGTDTSLYTVNLVTGDATKVGPVAGTTVTGLAVQSDGPGLPSIGLDSTTGSLVQFNTATPGTTKSVTVTGLTAGESLVGIDYRPATGQLYGVGFDSTTGTGGSASLYRVDPQTGAATLVGAAGGLGDGAGAPVDLSGTTNFGFDFNPTKDAIRVTTNTGVNLRVSPSTGAVTVDTKLAGSTANASGVAYTNSFGQTVGTGTTSLYGLDADTDTLFLITNPNGGTTGTGIPVKLAGTTPLDFSAVNGFDIPAGVRVSASNTAAAGIGYATLTVAGVSGLYSIDLATGAATLLGANSANEGLALGDGAAGTVSFTSATFTVAEGAGSVNLTLTRTGDTSGPATVTVNLTDGTATAGSDYTGTPVTVTFAAGSSSATAVVPITDDTVFEGPETFTATIAPTAAAVVGANGTATVTITDNDTQPTVSIADASVAEGDAGTTALTFTLTLSGASATPVTVTVNTADGTATAGSDYVPAVSQVVTFAPGTVTQTFTVNVIGDTTNEPNETFTATLSAPTGATVATGKDTATGTITNDDAPTSTPTVSIADASVAEGNSGTTALTFTLTLSAASLTPVTVTVNTADGTATAGSDYVPAVSQVVTFAPGTVTQTFTVNVIGDTTNEPNETFTVALSAPTNADLGTPATATGTITNDDAPATTPTVSIANASVAEGNTGVTPLTFTVTLSAASLTPVTVTANTADGTATATSDYVPALGQVITFAPGVVSQTFTVNVIGDTTNEPDETFTVTLSAPTGATLGTDTATGTIVNDDSAATPTVSIANASVAEGNTGTTMLTFTVTLSAASTTPVTVLANTKDGTATSGSDYVPLVGQLVTFAPGETSKTVSVLVNGDTTNEPDETFTITLSAPTGATVATGKGTATGTITNDDDVVSVIVDSVAKVEGNSGTTAFVFTVSLKGTTSQPVTVTVGTANNTATAGSDYTALTPTTLTFAPGETTKTVTVLVNGDTTVEGDETFYVTLSAPTNATLGVTQGVGTIINDDGVTTPTPSKTLLVGSPVTAIGAGSGTPTVRLIAADGSQISSSAAFASSFTGGVRTAVADVNGDGVPDVVVGTGPGTSSLVRVLDGSTGKELFSVAPFEASFTGGVFVAVGDINGDGVPDVIISPDEGGGPRVDIYNGKNFSKIDSFFGIDDPAFRGGARVAVGDINGDGVGDLAVAAGFQGGPRVAAFDGKTLGTSSRVKLFNDFFAFENTLRNGVYIGVGDVDGDGFADIIAGGGPGGGPRVTVFNGATLVSSGGATLSPLANFFAGDTANRLGVQVAVKDLDGDNKADLRTVVGGSDTVTTYLGKDLTPTGTPTGTTLDGLPNFNGGVFIG